MTVLVTEFVFIFCNTVTKYLLKYEVLICKFLTHYQTLFQCIEYHQNLPANSALTVGQGLPLFQQY